MLRHILIHHENDTAVWVKAGNYPSNVETGDTELLKGLIPDHRIDSFSFSSSLLDQCSNVTWLKEIFIYLLNVFFQSKFVFFLRNSFHITLNKQRCSFYKQDQKFSVKFKLKAFFFFALRKKHSFKENQQMNLINQYQFLSKECFDLWIFFLFLFCYLSQVFLCGNIQVNRLTLFVPVFH